MRLKREGDVRWPRSFSGHTSHSAKKKREIGILFHDNGLASGEPSKENSKHELRVTDALGAKHGAEDST